MAAYHHILIPLEISIQDDPELEKQFTDTYGTDFILKSIKHIERFSPELPNGERLDWSYDKKTYALPEGIVRSEFAAFARMLFEEWYNLYESKFKDKFYTTQISAIDLESQIYHVNALVEHYPLAGDKLKDQLRQLDDNFYFATERVHQQSVSQGFPINTDKHASFLALNFLNSYKKIGVNPDEYAAMVLLVESIREKYSQQFVLAKYLFLAGF